METLLNDVRYAFRMLRNAPVFAAVAIITLALGIGANSVIFSVIDAVLLRPLPFTQPEQLVRLYETEDAPGKYPFTGPDFLDWKTQNHSFQDMALLGWPHDMNLSDAGRADHVIGVPTESNFFQLLGARPLLGRTWAPGEDMPGKDQVVILAFGLWQSHFAGDPKVIGRSVEINSAKYTVVGVMGPAFHYPQSAQLWTPQDMDSKSLGQRGSHSFAAIGRLKPGVTLAQAQAEMSVIAANLEKQYPDSNHKVGAALVQLREDQVGSSRSSLATLLWAVGLVLLIACANVANLLLSRALARQREMAIRSALGAGRAALIRQLLTESVILALIGGGLGLLLATVGVGVIAGVKHLGIPRVNAIEVNPTVLAFTFALAVLTGILFGIVPALHISRTGVFDELKGGAGSSLSPTRGRRFASDALVVAEVGVSLLLLVSAGLLLKDFMLLRNSNVGVRSQGVITAAVILPKAKYPEQQQMYSFQQALSEKVAQIAGLESSAISNRLPLEGGSNSYIHKRGDVFRPLSGALVESHAVTPGYFRTMGIPLVQGRVFTPADMSEELARDAHVRDLRKQYPDNAPAAEMNAIVYPTVINRVMVRTFWPDQDPIGQMFSYGKEGPWYQVIGVVGDVKEWGLTNPPVPEAYTVLDGDSRIFVVAHTTLPADSVVPQIRQAVAQLDADLPLFNVRTMDQVIADQAVSQQFLATLVGMFSTLALVLAAVGIYGVLSYLVTQRTREIGIRMSLGATRGRVLGLVLTQGLKLAGTGLAIGFVAAPVVSRLLAGTLHEVKWHDPTILVATPICLALVAYFACYVPARRATKVDPVVALRYE